MTTEENKKGEEFGTVLKELGFYSRNIENTKSLFCNEWNMKDSIGETHWVADLIDTTTSTGSKFCPRIYQFEIIKNETGLFIEDKKVNGELVWDEPNNVDELRNSLHNVILLFKQLKVEIAKENLSKDFVK